MDHQKLDILKEALPYIQKFKGKTFVIKMSGKVAANGPVLASLAEEITLLQQVGFYPVLIHGGGPQVNELAERLGVEQTIVNGRRVTDEKTLEIAKMVFAGKINTDVTSALRGIGARVVGLSGMDGKMISAKRRDPKKLVCEDSQQEIEVDFGFVGDVVDVDISLIRLLLDQGYVPVISSLAADEDGVVYNINADTIAGEIAMGLQAEKMIYLTDVNGIYMNMDDPDSRIDFLTADGAQQLIEDGVVNKGMIPKITSILQLLSGGVHSAHVVGALEENALLKEIFTNRGTGTMITSGESER